jgi:hypothetical protein
MASSNNNLKIHFQFNIKGRKEISDADKIVGRKKSKKTLIAKVVNFVFCLEHHDFKLILNLVELKAFTYFI